MEGGAGGGKEDVRVEAVVPDHRKTFLGKTALVLENVEQILSFPGPCVRTGRVLRETPEEQRTSS